MDYKKIREKLYVIIFEAETPLGKAFDIALLWLISISVLAVLLESVAEIQENFGFALRTLEWIFTMIFLAEYILRVYCSPHPIRYIFSFFGMIDLLSIIPTLVSYYFVGSHSLLVIRGFRLLRVFRILKLGRYTSESKVLVTALKASRPKITVFLMSVLGLVLVMGSVMYLIEGEESGFTSIPKAIYWAIVTMTTVGYGDLVPKTVLGQMFASIIMICGYAIIAVPTGIVSVELANAEGLGVSSIACSGCGKKNHPVEAVYCMKCGKKLF